MYENVIWEGRFQPIHMGHVDYIETLLSYARRLFIVVLENERASDIPDFRSPVPQFSEVVDRHHAAEKNPYPLWLRHLLVVETVKAEIGGNAPIYIWAGRRMDIAWEFYKRALPRDRVFLTPERDYFEDAKAEAWRMLGEKVERINVDHIRKVSATRVRQSLAEGKETEGLLSPTTDRLLREFDLVS